jgi:pyridinium-3,5-biscarboxylic acid mononucleotide sulfurtransferase
MYGMRDDLGRKEDALVDLLVEMEAAVVAYSGGVDSSYLASVAATTLGERSLCVTAVSPSLARRELDSAVSVARRFGWNHRTIGTHEVGREDYARNDGSRCYYCKSELFDVLTPIAAERSAPILVATNSDDLSDYRPGHKAADERGVRAPLVEVGLTKAEVRTLSARRGLPTADKPASPCLSSRIAYGVRVTPERLRRIDRAEDYLLSLGFDIVRVRDHGDLARIEVPRASVDRLVSIQDEVEARLKDLGWRYVTVDLGGFRSGSMNAALLQPTFRRAGE